MEPKMIIILGASGSGKTYAVREAFKVKEKYGTYEALETNKYITNNYQYLPEPRANAIKTQEFRDFINNGNTTITTVNSSFKSYFFEEFQGLDSVEVLLLNANGQEFTRNINARGESQEKDKNVKIKKSIKENMALQARRIGKKWKNMTQTEIINYLNQILWS